MENHNYGRNLFVKYRKYVIILYVSLHAMGINGVKFITKNIDKLKEKRLVVFASGASPLSEEDPENVDLVAHPMGYLQRVV